MLQLPEPKLSASIHRRRRRANARVYALLLLGLILSSATVFGQSTYGAIIGTVKDSSGAAVPGAAVGHVKVQPPVESATV